MLNLLEQLKSESVRYAYSRVAWAALTLNICKATRVKKKRDAEKKFLQAAKSRISSEVRNIVLSARIYAHLTN